VLGQANQRGGAAHPPIRPPSPVLPCCSLLWVGRPSAVGGLPPACSGQAFEGLPWDWGSYFKTMFEELTRINSLSLWHSGSGESQTTVIFPVLIKFLHRWLLSFRFSFWGVTWRGICVEVTARMTPVEAVWQYLLSNGGSWYTVFNRTCVIYLAGIVTLRKFPQIIVKHLCYNFLALYSENISALNGHGGCFSQAERYKKENQLKAKTLKIFWNILSYTTKHKQMYYI